MDVFITLQLSRSVRLNQKQFSGEIKWDILTLLTLPSADTKSAVFLRVPSLTKVQVRNFSLLHFQDGSVWSAGMRKCQCFCLFDIHKRVVFLKYHFLCHRSFPLKEIQLNWLDISLFLIFIHQNTKSTTILCIYNILEERLKVPSKISLIDVDPAYHQEAKTIKFIHLLINTGATSQGRPNSVLKGRPRDVPRTRIWKYFTKHITVIFSSTSLHQMCCVKYWKIICCILIQFWRTVLWTF